MKKKIICCLCLMMCFFVGCGEKKIAVENVQLSRDPALTGGVELSFLYDQQTGVATFGGEGQKIAYYYEDQTLGRTGGCRVGVKISPPKEIHDFSGATLSFNGRLYDNSQMFESDTKNIYIYPIVSEQNMTNTVEIIWNSNTKPQTYIIQIAQGTEFSAPTQKLNTLTKQSEKNFNQSGIFVVRS